MPEIFKRLPPLNTIRTYHEPFLGGGAVFFSLQPEKAFLSDINAELINAYLAVRDSVTPLIRTLRRHRYEHDYYYSLRDADRSVAYQRWSGIRRAARLIYLNKTCYNGLFRVNSRGEFNTPFGRYVNPTIVDPDNLRACSQVLKKATIKQARFDEIVTRAKKGDFVYFDPPYAPVSKTAYFTNYNKDGFDIEMQRKLATVCKKLDAKGVKFLLSNSAVPFIFDLYENFNIETVWAGRAVNSKAKKRGKVREVLVRNY